MIGRKLILAETPIEASQLQPASLDLRLSKEAYRVRSSFLPGRGGAVRDRLKSLNAEPVSLAGKGAVLEKGIVYVARLMERLELRPNLSGAANPKSSTGRIDIFTRLIVDGGEAFDDVPLDYKGELWLEISPRSFSVRVKAGTKLNQVRFRSRNSQQRDKHTFTLDDADLRKRHLAFPLIDSQLDLREGVVLRIDLGGLSEPTVGYRAIRNSDVIDVNRLTRLPDRGFLGADSRPRGSQAHPRPRSVLHSGLAREGADPPGSCGGNGADRSGVRGVSRSLRRLLRSRLRAGRRGAPVRARGARSA